MVVVVWSGSCIQTHKTYWGREVGWRGAEEKSRYRRPRSGLLEVVEGRRLGGLYIFGGTREHSGSSGPTIAHMALLCRICRRGSVV